MDILVFRINADGGVSIRFTSKYSFHGLMCISKSKSCKFITRDGLKGRIIYRENKLSMMIMYN